jgi:hypothetical protein
MADLDVRPKFDEDVSRVTCPRCGRFEIAGDAWNLYEQYPSATVAKNRYLLSGRARNASLDGRVDRFVLQDFSDAEHDRIPTKTTEEKIVLMLGWFQRNSTKFGDWLTPVSSTDYPIAYCTDEHEWTSLIWALVQEGSLCTQGQQFAITLSGTRKLDEGRPMPKPPTHEATDMSALPLHFAHYKADVERFLRDGAFEDSVFVMMKFPDPKMPRPVVDLLDAIFKTIRDELSRYGLNARRANDKTYAAGRQLWDNLCVYMLGCKYGLAVLEDRSGEDFNPNVALEYGFMRALGRDAVLVKEREFKYIRADVLATIPKEFSIGLVLDEQSLRDAIEQWMIDLGRPARRGR